MTYQSRSLEVTYSKKTNRTNAKSCKQSYSVNEQSGSHVVNDALADGNHLTDRAVFIQTVVIMFYGDKEG